MSGFVYLIGNYDFDLVKIGYTAKHPSSRLKALQTGCPVPLSILGFMEGDPELEAKLHRTFAPLRLHGEWFRMEGKLVGFVLYFDEENCSTQPAAPDRLEIALHDNVLANIPPHPSMDHAAFLASADPSLWNYLLEDDTE